MKPLNDDIVEALKSRGDIELTIEDVMHGKKVTVVGKVLPSILRVHLNSGDSILLDCQNESSLDIVMTFSDDDASPLPDNLTTLPYTDHLPENNKGGKPHGFVSALKKNGCSVSLDTIHGAYRVKIHTESLPEVLREHINDGRGQLTDVSSHSQMTFIMIYQDSPLAPDPIPEDYIE